MKKSVLFTMLLLTGGLSSLISNNLCANAMAPTNPYNSTSKPYTLTASKTQSQKRKCLIVLNESKIFSKDYATVWIRNGINMYGHFDVDFYRICFSKKYNLSERSLGTHIKGNGTCLNFKSQEDLQQFMKDYEGRFTFQNGSIDDVEILCKPYQLPVCLLLGSVDSPNSRRVVRNFKILDSIASNCDNINNISVSSSKRPCNVVLNTSYIPVSISKTSCPLAQVWVQNDTTVEQDNFIFDREFFEIGLSQKYNCLCDFVLSKMERENKESCLLFYSEEDLNKFKEDYKDRFTFHYSSAPDINFFEFMPLG